MNNACICIFSNSGYSSLRPLLSYTLKKINTKYPVYIFTDKVDGYTELYNFKNIIIYTDTDTYSQKLASCIEKIEESYMILYQEKDLLFSLDHKKIDTILECMDIFDIQTVDLHLNTALYIPTKHDIATEEEKRLFPTNFYNINYAKSITKIYKNVTFIEAINYYYSAGPRIWKIYCLKDILSHFPTVTYRNIECDEIQNYMKSSNYISYKLGISEDDSIVYAGKGFRMLNYFSWLSITNFRSLIGEEYWCDLRPNMEKALEEIGMTKEQFYQIKLY